MRLCLPQSLRPREQCSAKNLVVLEIFPRIIFHANIYHQPTICRLLYSKQADITLVPAFWPKGCFRTRFPSILHHLVKSTAHMRRLHTSEPGSWNAICNKMPFLSFQPFSSLTSEEMRTCPIQALTPTWVRGRINMDKYDPGKFLGKF
jgi:hypothetical protein